MTPDPRGLESCATNTTRLRPGCDEPGIYIYGEMGIRHEDIIFITDEGAENMTKWTGSPEEPAVV